MAPFGLKNNHPASGHLSLKIKRELINSMGINPMLKKYDILTM